MCRHYDKWARRQEINCYRVYDRDLDEFPLVIDRYGDQVLVVDYTATPTEGPPPDEMLERRRKLELRETLAEAMTVSIKNIHLNSRTPDPTAKPTPAARPLTVTEDGLKYRVNLDTNRDTGLFLDQRELRKLIRAEAAGKEVLDLFGSTGAFTVAAAAGGAAAVQYVELSNTNLEWSKKNLAANDLDPAAAKYRFERADVSEWLRMETEPSYDLVVMDAPAYRNSKAMRHPLDLQEDHPYLINAALRHLRRDGRLYFATSAPRFKLADDKIFGGTTIKEITPQTTPADFAKSKPHRAWRIDLTLEPK